jgi:hypothetical protein
MNRILGSRAVLATGTVAAVLALGGCGQQEITADTSCKDYLAHEGAERSDAAVRLSSELGAPNGGNPMWALSLDAACGSNRDMTLRDYFQQ